MRIVGWPEELDAEGGIEPVTIVDVDFHGTPDELRAIANFLMKAAAELEYARSINSALNIGIKLRNSNPSAGVGLAINVVRHSGD